ncbi:MAG: C25 family cysteine peptidase [Acidobacteriota bacterium]
MTSATTRKNSHLWMTVTALTLVIGAFLSFEVSAVQGEIEGGGRLSRFKLFIEETGVYAVTYDDLAEAGLRLRAVPSKSMGMTNQGQEVPVWVEDGGDGIFEAGDRILFVGKRLRGEYSYLDEYSRFNCYMLDLEAGDPLRGRDIRGGSSGDAIDLSADLFVRSRFEEDTVMVRYPERPDESQERWYWSRLSVTDREPWKMTLTLDGLRRERKSNRVDARDLRNLTVVGAAGEDTRKNLHEIFGSGDSVTAGLALRIGLRGWSKPHNAQGLVHHHVSIKANGREVPPAEWDGSDPFIHQIEFPLHNADSTQLELEIGITRRMVPETDNLFVDVVMLNWIEVDYLRESGLREGQSRFDVQTDGQGEIHAIDIVADGDGWLYGSGDGRVEVIDGHNRVEGRSLGRGPIFPVVGDAYREVDHIDSGFSSILKTAHRQTDYIMITHRRLLEALQPLVEFHRANGLSVAVVDVEDIYDEFNYGIQHPRSLRDFLKWAYDNWQEPKPRFVLLAGDASWDFKNLTADDAHYADWTYRPGEARHFVKNTSSSYEDMADVNHRNLVPTWSYQTSQGHAASDNWLVCVDGDDIYPDMAVGRIPVTEPDELAAVIQKTIAYADNGPVGSWRKKLLFITNESKGFQRASDRTSEVFEDRGYLTRKIYPSSEETANEEHTVNMVRAFDEGLLMVQFLGHGGRYIWRTGPPDLEKNHDLFTLEHLDTLATTGKLPFVISLTCYSAPFDHPTADSIGEKLLRLDGKGAIGVFAASWRNSPSSNMGRIVMDELTTPGATIGEALMRAKYQLRSPTLVETYNLLGDPAISLDLAPDVAPPASDEVEQKAKVNERKPESDKAPPSPADLKADQGEVGQCKIDADGKEKK